MIYNGIEVGRFNPDNAVCTAARQKLDLPLETPVIGMVANLVPVKRHDLLLKALMKVRERVPDVKCLLIGDGVLRATLEGMVQQMGLSETVVFLGSRPDVAGLLPALDVFVLSSDSESFSMAIVEAMASGKPVIATNSGGPGEIVIEGETGFLVPIGQPSSLAEKITLLLQNPTLAHQMGQKARCRAVNCFSLERMISAREMLFSDLLEREGLAQ